MEIELEIRKLLKSGKFTSEQLEEAITNDSMMYRPRLFSQMIAANKEIQKWVDATNCIELLYDIYENAFVFGGCYMFEAVCKDVNDLDEKI